MTRRGAAAPSRTFAEFGPLRARRSAAAVRTFGGMPAPITADLDLIFEIGPSFGPEDAARLHEAIERAAPGTRVEIDFHRVRVCHDAALAVLARDIAAGRARVALRGMSQHQLRMLGYLGVAGA